MSATRLPGWVTRMSHAELQANVFDACAKFHITCVCHFRPARVTVRGKETWRTPIEGKVGFPDLAMAFGGRALFAELKTVKDDPSIDQLHWLAALGSLGRLWRPEDWASGAITADLLILAGRTSS
jgi:hypothetical protein